MTIRIIACVSSNYGLGDTEGNLLFEIKDDLKHFQKLTEGTICIQGRKTFDSIVKRNKKPLGNGRINVVLTRDKNYSKQFNEFVFNSVEDILKGIETMSEKDKDISIIGGASIYEELLPYVDEVVLTHVNKHIENASAYYPIQLQRELGFEMSISQAYWSDEENTDYVYATYTRKKN